MRSLKYLQLEEDPDLCVSFLAAFRHLPLRRQSVITAMAALRKSHSEDNAVSCLVVASENGDVYVLDPEAFTVLKQVYTDSLTQKLFPYSLVCDGVQFLLPSSAVFVAVSGLYDVEYHISAACRDNCIYTFKRFESHRERE